MVKPSAPSETDPHTHNVQGVALGVAVDADGPLAGLLLLGESGIGKSSLALSLIDQCQWQRSALVADDVVILKVHQGQLLGRSPIAIKNLIEIRGFGPTPVKSMEQIQIKLALTLSQEEGARIADIGQWSPSGCGLDDDLAVAHLAYQYGGHSPQNTLINHHGRVQSILRSLLSGHIP